MKKKIMTFTSLALLSSALFTGVASADTVTVKAGDTLYKLATTNQTTVNQLKSWNNLTSNTIYTGQTLKVSDETNVHTETSTSYETVTVKAGDTLYKLSQLYNATVDQLKMWNGLTSNTIYVGQSLKVSEDNSAILATNIIAKAKTYMGVPYVFGGSTPSGFDCSGFIYYVLKSQGFDVNRLSTAGYWSLLNKVNVPQPGDIVFFQNTYKAGPSHMGIYLGNNEFIHASSSKGVTISNLTSTYYKDHFLGYGTFIR